jgi:hypothetical protein
VASGALFGLDLDEQTTEYIAEPAWGAVFGKIVVSGPSLNARGCV